MGASRDCRYSGTRRDIGGIRGPGGFLEGVGSHFGGIRGVLGAGRDSRSPRPEGIGNQGALGVPRGCRGC